MVYLFIHRASLIRAVCREPVRAVGAPDLHAAGDDFVFHGFLTGLALNTHRNLWWISGGVRWLSRRAFQQYQLHAVCMAAGQNADQNLGAEVSKER